MSQAFLKNGDKIDISGMQVVTHKVVNVPIKTFMPGAPLNAGITYPIGALTGRLKIVAGMGTLPHTLTASIVIDPVIPTFVNRAIAITGPGTYYLPVARNELCRGCKRITTNTDPGGTITVSLDSWTATLAGDASASNTVVGVVYNASGPSAPGVNLLIVQSGVATVMASGVISKGDTLITAPDGAVKSAGMTKMVDVVGTAVEDAIDGATFLCNVALSSI